MPEEKINLRTLANEIALQEGLESKVGVAQVSELIALLGIRWRNMPEKQALQEFHCIVDRAGKRSEHKRQMKEEGK